MISESTQSIPDIRLVVFDLGRVLIRICRDWEQACTRAGINWPAHRLDSSTQSALGDAVHDVEAGSIGFEAFADRAASLLELRSGDIRSLSAAYIFGAYPGAQDLVSELTSAGIGTACLSNTNEHHWGLMSDRTHPASFPLERFDHAFASHLIRARKPDDAIYVHLEQQAGIGGSSILFFDDVSENVRAAQLRGWNAHRIDPAPDEPIAQIRGVLRSYELITG